MQAEGPANAGPSRSFLDLSAAFTGLTKAGEFRFSLSPLGFHPQPVLLPQLGHV